MLRSLRLPGGGRRGMRRGNLRLQRVPHGCQDIRLQVCIKSLYRRHADGGLPPPFLAAFTVVSAKVSAFSMLVEQWMRACGSCLGHMLDSRRVRVPKLVNCAEVVEHIVVVLRCVQASGQRLVRRAAYRCYAWNSEFGRCMKRVIVC